MLHFPKKTVQTVDVCDEMNFYDNSGVTQGIINGEMKVCSSLDVNSDR